VRQESRPVARPRRVSLGCGNADEGADGVPLGARTPGPRDHSRREFPVTKRIGFDRPASSWPANVLHPRQGRAARRVEDRRAAAGEKRERGPPAQREQLRLLRGRPMTRSGSRAEWIDPERAPSRARERPVCTRLATTSAAAQACAGWVVQAGARRAGCPERVDLQQWCGELARFSSGGSSRYRIAMNDCAPGCSRPRLPGHSAERIARWRTSARSVTSTSRGMGTTTSVGVTFSGDRDGSSEGSLVEADERKARSPRDPWSAARRDGARRRATAAISTGA